jgi:hypothetical protein
MRRPSTTKPLATTNRRKTVVGVSLNFCSGVPLTRTRQASASRHPTRTMRPVKSNTKSKASRTGWPGTRQTSVQPNAGTPSRRNTATSSVANIHAKPQKMSVWRSHRNLLTRYRLLCRITSSTSVRRIAAGSLASREMYLRKRRHVGRLLRTSLR